MHRTCIVNDCKQIFEKNTNLFYSLPKDKEQLARWLSAMNKKTDIKPTHVVCSKHFRDSDFVVNSSGQKVLKPLAVPSVFENKAQEIKSQKKVKRKQKKTSKRGKPDQASKYNLRKREKPNNVVKPKSKSTQRNLDHTYSTSKPEPSEPTAPNVDPKVNISDHTYFTSAKLDTFSDLSDHTYTRLSAARDPEGGDPSQRHDEHNYSLNSGKKRSKLETPDQNVQIYHDDHAYLSTNQKDGKISETENENLVENAVLDLRDHTYSKINKKLKKEKASIDKSQEKKSDPQQELLNLTPRLTQIKKPKTPLITSNKESALASLTECVLLRQIARQYVPVKEFNQLKPCLFILKPDLEQVAHGDSIENSINPSPTYILVDEKYFKADEADLAMENTSNLFKEVFNRTLSDIKISPPVSYYQDLCCEQFNVTQLLRSCAVRRRFAQPRYVGDYKITDMDCAKNAKRYYELSKTRMESQKFLIQKLRTQNSRLSHRFRKLSQEILKMKKDGSNVIINHEHKTLNMEKV